MPGGEGMTLAPLLTGASCPTRLLSQSQSPLVPQCFRRGKSAEGTPAPHIIHCNIPTANHDMRKSITTRVGLGVSVLSGEVAFKKMLGNEQS